MIEINHPPSFLANPDVDNHEGGVRHQVVADRSTHRVLLKRVVAVMDAHVCHHFSMAIIGEIGVEELPLRVGSSSKDITAVVFSVIVHRTNLTEPWFLNKQDIVFAFRVE